MASAQVSSGHDVAAAPVACAIEPYEAGHVAAVRAFNRRLAGAGSPFAFPEQPESGWLPKSAGGSLFEEYFVARGAGAGQDDVRGGYVLKHQPFSAGGRELPVGSLYLPLSEGIVDPRYRSIGRQILRDGLRRAPLLYSLGMGGFENPYPRLLRASGWRLFAVPFFFAVVRPERFLRGITFLRGDRWRRAGLGALALTGLGRVGLALAQARPGREARDAEPVEAELTSEIGAWADEIWEAARADYALVGWRDAAALRRLYHQGRERVLRLAVRRGKRVVGWAVLLDTRMSDHKQFGDLRVGSVVDVLARPGDEPAVAAAAAAHLRARGVDLIVTNQAHRRWRTAFLWAGFLPGPSNYIFAASPDLARELAPFDVAKDWIHVTRGDGEGPIHL